MIEESHQPLPDRICDSCCPPGHIQLHKNIAQMPVDRARADYQNFGYLAVRMAFGNQAQHLLFTPGQVEIEMVLRMYYSIPFLNLDLRLSLANLSRPVLSPGYLSIVLFQLLHTFLQRVHQVNGPPHSILEK